jgi:hypothetical protein
MSIKNSNRNKIIVLTPVKNEAWFLDIFLAATSIWADKIIIADQYSTDSSRKIAAKYKKVIIVNSPSLKYFNEYKMRSVLFKEARKIIGKKILFAVDSDEIITPNVMNSSEWEKIVSSKPGTVIEFQWANICPNLKKYWSPNIYFAKGFVDDGSPYKAGKIHTLNIPFPKYAKIVRSKNIKLMHFQYVDWERMKSKHRWYQCWERINNPTKSSISIYRQYHHMYQIKECDYKDIPSKWFLSYENKGVNLSGFEIERHYWRDTEVLKFMRTFGAKYFSNEAIWDVNWAIIANDNRYRDVNYFSDPRNLKQKIIQYYLDKTQKFYPNTFIVVIDWLIEKILKI